MLAISVFYMKYNCLALRLKLRLVNISDAEPGQSYRVATKAEEEGESRYPMDSEAPMNC